MLQAVVPLPPQNKEPLWKRIRNALRSRVTEATSFPPALQRAQAAQESRAVIN